MAESPRNKLSDNLLEYLKLSENVNLPFQPPDDLSGLSDLVV